MEKRIWTSDSGSNKIYKHNMDNNLSVLSSYIPKKYMDKKYVLSGIAWDGKYIWTISEGESYIYRHSIEGLIEKSP